MIDNISVAESCVFTIAPRWEYVNNLVLVTNNYLQYKTDTKWKTSPRMVILFSSYWVTLQGMI